MNARYRLDHAVVMDTDDIPGRGGYAVVGISRGVAQAERLFVAQNFGISDFLHDPQNDRTFYSFFRVPGGRHAFTRRFANGRRRNGTQNRLFVHTIFFDDVLFDGLAGLPWLLLEGNVRAEGTDAAFQPLRNDVPWVAPDGVLPALELEIDAAVAEDVPRRLNARLALAGKDVENAPAAVAATIGALRDRKRVLLPQGRGAEWLTLLAWSMLPRRDREELAWTQHDTLNISGVTFHLANAVNPAAEPGAAVALDRAAAPVATRIVQRNTASVAEWREFHQTAEQYGLSIRRSEVLEACFTHRDAIHEVRVNLGAPEAMLREHLKRLAATGKSLRGQACFEGEGILTLLWSHIAAQEPVDVAIDRWAALLRDSGLAEVVFRDAPDRRWLDRAAVEGGADVLVDFLFRATEGVAGVEATRNALAEWVTAGGARGVEGMRMARLVVRAYADRSASRREMLQQFLGNGLAAATAGAPPRVWFALLVQLAGELDAADDAADARAFVEAVRRLPAAKKMDGTIEPLLDVLDQPNLRVGSSMRALLLLARPAWTPRVVPVVAKLVGRTYSSAADWAETVTALAHDHGKTAEVSDLVAQFWMKVAPEDVPRLPAGSVDAIAHVQGADRRALVDTWRTRIRRLPEGESGVPDRLLAALFTNDADVRAPLAWRRIEQGTADEATLNALDAALYQQQGPRYTAEMASAIAKFVGESGRAARVRGLCKLLRSPHVLPTVKRVIETNVLPQALQPFREGDWNELAQARDEELFCRGAATLMIAFQLGANADDTAVSQYERACRTQRRNDAAASLAAGRRSRRTGGRLSRWMGTEPQR